MCINKQIYLCNGVFEGTLHVGFFLEHDRFRNSMFYLTFLFGWKKNPILYPRSPYGSSAGWVAGRGVGGVTGEGEVVNSETLACK